MKTYDEHINWRNSNYQYSYGIHNGNILIPVDSSKKYPVLYLIHGMGAAMEWQNNNIAGNMNQWIENYDFEPMIIVMPTLPPESNGRYSSDSYYNYILKHFKELIEYISVNFSSHILEGAKYHAVAGASMGGAGALYAGILFRDYFMHVGGFSPAQQLHIYDNSSGWISNFNNLIFNEDISAVHYMGYSKGEDKKFSMFVSNYNKVFSNNGFMFDVFSTDRTGHNYVSFNKELFAFLYLLNRNELPPE